MPNTNKFRNVLFGQNFCFTCANSQREQYPFYNRIKFNYRTDNTLKNALKEYNFFEQFIEDYITADLKLVSFIKTTENQQSRIERMELPLFDMPEWIQQSDLTLNEENKVIFEPNLKTKSSYKYYLDKLAFIGKLRKILQRKDAEHSRYIGEQTSSN